MCMSSFILDDYLEKSNGVPQSAKYKISAQYLFIEQITGYMGGKSLEWRLYYIYPEKHTEPLNKTELYSLYALYGMILCIFLVV